MLVPAPTKTQEVQALEAKQLPHQWSLATQAQQKVPGLWWRLFERIPVQQSKLTVNKTRCCWREKDSAQCWICGTAVCERCASEDPDHSVLFQKLVKTSWCHTCLADSLEGKPNTVARRVRCCNDECTKLLYSEGPLQAEAQACSQICFEVWQAVEKFQT